MSNNFKHQVFQFQLLLDSLCGKMPESCVDSPYDQVLSHSIVTVTLD